MKQRLGLLALVFAVACGGEYRPARETYNEGTAALASGELDNAEKLLLDARSEAGVDPDLRFRAAFDLGVAYAQHSQKTRAGQDADLSKALELAQQAVSWFSDAQRLRKEDPPTIQNLAVARARVQALTDELRRAEGKLEARLDAVIKDQREVLDEARTAWFSIKHAGGADPLAQQGPLTHLADRERGVVSEAGVVSDLAADEIDTIAKKPEDKRSDEDRIRIVQLKALDLYLQDGRARIAEARRKLQDLAAEDGVARAEAALVALKRARDQLLDPITVLKGVAQDQVSLIQDTAMGGGGEAFSLQQKGPVPGWLAPAVLGDRQGGLRDRVDEVKARLMAAVTDDKPDGKPDPQQAKLLERVRAALPSVAAASDAMDRARKTLSGNQLTEALDHERAALEALARAIEQFSDLKQTVELAYAEQQQIGKLLVPPDGAAAADPRNDAKDRAKQTADSLARNVDRMARLKGLIADQLAEIEAKAAAPKQPPPGAGSGSAAAPDPKQEDAAKQQVEAAKQQMARAEQLRGDAATAIDALVRALAATKTDKPDPKREDPLVHAKTAETKLEELRKLLFSVIEHLQQLIRDQGETRDQTSAIAGADDIARAPKLPGLIEREDGHGTMAKAITDALAAQADAAGKTGQQPQPGAPDAKALSAAAAEVRLGQSSMGDASGTLIKARDATKTSETIKPALDNEAKAIEHLENALKLLQPPKQNKDQKKQDQQQQDQQEKDQQQQQQQQQAGQRARDEDARQQKRKQQRKSDPVDKDW